MTLIVVGERITPQAILKHWALDREVTASIDDGEVVLRGVSDAVGGSLMCAIGAIKALGHRVRNMVLPPHLA